MQYFVSDNASPVHPEVMQAIVDANHGYELAYGQDTLTAKATAIFKEQFKAPCDVFFVTTGTSANVIALKSVLQPFEAIICSDCAHLHRDECGAPEAILGVKLLIADASEGKLTPKSIKPLLQDTSMVHRVQPRVVSIAQCTEWGTVYSVSELQALSEFCRQHKLLLHVDGARLANAACALGVSFSDLCLNGGVDLLSFGGTKNGLMGAEAVIVFNRELARKTAFIHKQCMQLSSKMRYIAAQFIALLQHDLWQRNASNANQMAALLYELVHNDVDIIMPVSTNVVFAKLPKESIKSLQEQYPFIVWDTHHHIVRWMTSYDTTEDTVMSFSKAVKEVVHGRI